MDWIATARRELDRQGLDAWLLYDFRGSNPISGRFLGRLLTGPGFLSRRVFLRLPREGRPTLLVHAIERGSLPELPDVEVRAYSSREALERELRSLLADDARVAMEVSPMADIPYVSRVDAGTAELVRAQGVELCSSAELLQAFAAWTPRQLELHEAAAARVHEARDLAFAFLAERVAADREVRETEVQAVIVDHFEAHGLEIGHPPIVGFGAHAGDPHYAPEAGRDARLRPGDAVLVDLWAKLPEPEAPYADVTWMGCCGGPSVQLAEVWEVVREAREAAFTAIAEAYRHGRHPEGREIDRVAREVIAAHGYGDAFLHRTGHSLGTRATHGDAAHLDDFETRDTRLLVPGLGLTIEPGIYLPEQGLGVRSEMDVYLEEDGPRATTGRQDALVVLELP